MVTGTRVVLITPCSASKSDSVPIPPGGKVVEPCDYLRDEELLSRLIQLRQTVFAAPEAQVGNTMTYAFDLYVGAGKAYDGIRRYSYEATKEMLMGSPAVQWFFLSGGFGIVHAFEKAHKYQATFSESIARQRGIPYTASVWGETLVRICDSILWGLDPEWVYAFGSGDYTRSVKKTRYYAEKDTIKVFESVGLRGTAWTSCRLYELVGAIAAGDLSRFNHNYRGKYIRQVA